MNNTIQYKSVRLLLVLLLSFFGSNIANAQITDNEVRFDNIESYISNGSLYLSFDVEMQGKFLPSGDALHIVPVYRTATDEVRLPKILINSKKRSPYYRREQSLMSNDKGLANKPYKVIVRDDNKTQQVTYDYVLLLPESMSKKGSLQLDQFLEDCCDEVLVNTHLLPLEYRMESINPSMFANTVTYIVPEAEKLKKRNDHIIVRIDYPVNKYEVLPGFGDNQTEIEKMERDLNPLFSDKKTYRIVNAVIKGYASPESTYEYNLNLSRRRTDTFKKYLIDKYGLADLHDFPAQGMGEDWEGLLHVVEASNMEFKDEVIHIINTVGLFEGREKALMELQGGKPYNYMLKELYPPLRRMEMEINYNVRPFDIKEVESVIENRPSGLSEREIYDLAQSKKNKDLLKIAAIYFPNNATANINASSVALLNGDVDEAWTYLSKVQDKPEAYNNLGIYYWLKGDTDKAESYLRKAINVEGQKENAAYNIKMLETYLKN